MSEAKCEICGEPMPPGEQMFKFHGYSGPCPKPRAERATEGASANPTGSVTPRTDGDFGISKEEARIESIETIARDAGWKPPKEEGDETLEDFLERRLAARGEVGNGET